MTAKKIIITLLAILAILIAIYGVWRWQEKTAGLPLRQEREIR